VPAAGGLPPGRYWAADHSKLPSTSARPAICFDVLERMTTPSPASRMAGCQSSAQGFVPYVFQSVS
jgi:hypothetical protein